METEMKTGQFSLDDDGGLSFASADPPATESSIDPSRIKNELVLSDDDDDVIFVSGHHPRSIDPSISCYSSSSESDFDADTIFVGDNSRDGNESPINPSDYDDTILVGASPSTESTTNSSERKTESLSVGYDVYDDDAMFVSADRPSFESTIHLSTSEDTRNQQISSEVALLPFKPKVTDQKLHIRSKPSSVPAKRRPSLLDELKHLVTTDKHRESTANKTCPHQHLQINKKQTQSFNKSQATNRDQISTLSTLFQEMWQIIQTLNEAVITSTTNEKCPTNRDQDMNEEAISMVMPKKLLLHFSEKYDCIKKLLVAETAEPPIQTNSRHSPKKDNKIQWSIGHHAINKESGNLSISENHSRKRSLNNDKDHSPVKKSMVAEEALTPKSCIFDTHLTNNKIKETNGDRVAYKKVSNLVETGIMATSKNQSRKRSVNDKEQSPVKKSMVTEGALTSKSSISDRHLTNNKIKDTNGYNKISNVVETGIMTTPKNHSRKRSLNDEGHSPVKKLVTKEGSTPKSSIFGPHLTKNNVKETDGQRVAYNVVYNKIGNVVGSKQCSGLLNTVKRGLLSTEQPSKSVPTTANGAKKPDIDHTKSITPRKSSQRGYGKPYVCTQTKIKKSKGGNQMKELEELKKLFDIVMTNLHLKNLPHKEEKDILETFVKMEQNKQYIVMTLYTWKKSWYNIYKFCEEANIVFDDDKNIAETFEILKNKKIVCTDYKNREYIDELLKQFECAKLKEIMEELGITSGKITKEEMINRMQEAARTNKSHQNLILEEIQKNLGKAVKVQANVVETFDKLYLLATFTNNYFQNIQDYFRLIICERIVLPEYSIEDYTIFHSKEKFSNYYRAIKYSKELDEILKYCSLKHKRMSIKILADKVYDLFRKLELERRIRTESQIDHKNAPHLQRFTAEYVCSELLYSCGEQIYTKGSGFPSKVKQWLEVLIRRYPRSNSQGLWYFRIIWLHMRHLETISYEKAAYLLIEVLSTKRRYLGETIEHELGGLGQAIKSCKKYKISQDTHDRITELLPKLIDAEFISKYKFESRVLQNSDYSMDKGAAIIANLLVLYFWDIIYESRNYIPGIFVSKMQNAPLDIFTEYFYKNRKEAIDIRLQEIEHKWSDAKMVKFGMDNWQNHSHQLSIFGTILSVISEENVVENLVMIIGRKVLAKIFKRLIKNLPEFKKTGMPDLIWSAKEKFYKFVVELREIDNYRPTLSQLLWLQYLKDSGASIGVVYVPSVKKTSREKPLTIS